MMRLFLEQGKFPYFTKKIVWNFSWKFPKDYKFKKKSSNCLHFPWKYTDSEIILIGKIFTKETKIAVNKQQTSTSSWADGGKH